MPPVRVPGRIALYGIFRPLRHSPLEQQPPKRTVSQCRVLQILVIAAHFFLSGLPRFSLSVFMSIAATAGAAKIYVFMGFHPGEPFQSVRTDNKWVRYKLLAIAKRVAKGYSSGFGIKNLQTSCVGLYFFHQGPNIPLLPPHAFQVSSNSYNHTVFGRMRLKKSSNRYASHKKT